MTIKEYLNQPATKRQLSYIQDMRDFSPYTIPHFEGTTRLEAIDYINTWSELAHESTWAIQNGYS